METTAVWKFTFFKFWLTQALSIIGSGLASFSVVWWITETTGSSTTLAVLSLAALLPGILFGPIAGAIVDQFNRKWIMIVSDAISAMMALLLVLLFWNGSIQIWHICAINVIRALAGAFQFPAVQSSTSLMVPKEHLARVAGLNQALQGISIVATPPLGALLLSFIPIHLILGIDVLTALIAIFLLLSILIPQPATHKTIKAISANVWQDMRAGFVFLKDWPALINIMGIASLLNMVLVPAFTLVPMLITKHFSGSVLQLGWMNAAYGFGIIIGGLVLGAWGGFKRRIHTSMLGLAGLGVGSFMIGTASSNGYWVAVSGMALIGIMNTFANGPFFAILQSVVPSGMQGRVFTVLMSISMSAAPIGLALAGPLADRMGVQHWYVLAAAICAVILVWIAFSPALMHLEEKQLPLDPVPASASD